jgi:hypothetical protein
MDHGFIKTSAYFFAAIFLLFLFVDDKALLIALIAVAGLIWVFDGFVNKKL